MVGDRWLVKWGRCAILVLASLLASASYAEVIERIDDLTVFDPATGEFAAVAIEDQEAPAALQAKSQPSASALRSLDDGITACSLNQDNAFPFDRNLFAVGAELALAPDGRYPYDATMNAAETEIWIVGASGDGVVVVDRVTNTVLRRIPVGQYPVSVVFTADGSKALVASRDDHLLTIVDTATYTVVGSLPLPAGHWAGHLALDPVSRKIYGVRWYNTELYEFAEDGSALLRSVTLGDSLWQLVISPDGQWIYVTDRDPTLRRVRILDRATLTEVDTIQVPTDPWGLDITADGCTLVVASEDTPSASVIDVASRTVRTIDLPGDDPRDVDILDASGLAFVPSGRSAVHVIDIASATLVFSFDVGCSSTNTIAVQGKASGVSCSSSLAAPYPVHAWKSVDDVSLSWAAVATADTYNTWRVETKQEIPRAHAPPTPGVTLVCGGAAPLGCDDPGAVSAPASYYYQVRSVCGCVEGAP